jgi:hypothetical protein
MFPNIIDWSWVGKNMTLSEDFILVHWNKLDINDIYKYQKITAIIAYRYKDQIDWTMLVKNTVLDEDVIHVVRFVINWPLVCQYQKLTENFMISHAGFIDWRIISMYQELSNEFMRKYFNKLDIQNICLFQNLSIDFIREYESDLDWSMLVKNKHYNREDTICIYTNGNKYFVIEPSDLEPTPKVNYFKIVDTLDI